MDLIYRYDPFQPIAVSRPANVEEAIQTLAAGNRRLVDLVSHMQRATVGETSSDEIVVPISPVLLGLPFFRARFSIRNRSPWCWVVHTLVPIESILDESFNEIFVVRIAGDAASTECVGSLPTACGISRNR